MNTRNSLFLLNWFILEPFSHWIIFQPKIYERILLRQMRNLPRFLKMSTSLKVLFSNNLIIYFTFLFEYICSNKFAIYNVCQFLRLFLSPKSYMPPFIDFWNAFRKKVVSQNVHKKLNLICLGQCFVDGLTFSILKPMWFFLKDKRFYSVKMSLHWF